MMTSARSDSHDPCIEAEAALFEIQRLISARYPDATFEISEGDDPEGLYLLATVDVEDTDEVAALYTERLLDFQVEHRLPVYVLPVRPTARVSSELSRRQGCSAALKAS